MPRVSITPEHIAPSAIRLLNGRISDPKNYRHRIVHDVVDQRRGDSLMFSGHPVGENDCVAGKRHTYSQRYNDEGYKGLRSIRLPDWCGGKKDLSCQNKPLRQASSTQL